MLATSWKHGQHFLEEKYSWITFTLQSITFNQNVSILAPYGTSLVMPSLTGGIDGTNMEEDTPSHHPDSLLDETSGM